MTQAIEKVSTGALASIPEHLRQYAGQQQGKENLNLDEVLIPRLAIAQKNNTPQLDEDSELYIPELNAGELFNTVTNEIYGETATIVPLFFYKNYIEFIPMDQGGGVVGQYETREQVPAGGLDWGQDDKGNTTKPRVTEFKNWMCLIKSEDGSLQPIVASFKSTGIKMAKKLGALIKLLSLPAYGREYTLTVLQKTKGALKWYLMVPAPGSFVSKELFVAAETYFNNLRAGGYKVDTTGLDPSDEPTEDGDTSFDATN